ncbi:STAS domain-containing protein [Streptomyces sp. NPDC005706]|uniref:STAS domain-containing protein n=1 Tax=Streptomyces sp. NPDC005706 TaxID=3157169 RepID=UPI0033E446C2
MTLPASLPGSLAGVPVLTLGDTLLVSLQGELHDGVAEQLQQDIAHRVAHSEAAGVVIDVSGVDIVDSFLGRVIAEIAANARLLAARTVLCGMGPAVAITLVELGLTLPGVVTALDVDRAFELLRQDASAAGPGEAAERA